MCLTSAHADCPRYLRGSMALLDPEAATRGSAVPRATLAAILVLVLSAGISFGFVVQRGGIELPAAGTTPTSTSIALEPPPSETPFVEPSADPTDAASAVASIEPSPSVEASAVAIAVANGLAYAIAVADPGAHALADARSDGGADGRTHRGPDRRADAKADEEADERSLQAPRRVPGPAELLDLHDPLGRQPVQHRPLLRHLPEHDLRLEPEVRQRRPPARRRQDPDATAHPVRARSSPSTPPAPVDPARARAPRPCQAGAERLAFTPAAVGATDRSFALPAFKRGARPPTRTPNERSGGSDARNRHSERPAFTPANTNPVALRVDGNVRMPRLRT